MVLRRPDRWEVHCAQHVVLSFDGIEVQVIQKPNKLSYEKIGVGACVWDGAMLLGGYLASLPRHRFIGMKCVELGAGVGALSVLLAKMGARVYSTDIEKVVPLLYENAAANEVAERRDGGYMECLELEWGAAGWMDKVSLLCDGGCPELVLAADCCYYDGEGPSPDTACFIETCRGLSGESTKVLISFERRSSAVREDLLRLARESFDMVMRVDTSHLCPSLRLEYCDLWQLEKPK